MVGNSRDSRSMERASSNFNVEIYKCPLWDVTGHYIPMRFKEVQLQPSGLWVIISVFVEPLAIILHPELWEEVPCHKYSNHPDQDKYNTKPGRLGFVVTE